MPARDRPRRGARPDARDGYEWCWPAAARSCSKKVARRRQGEAARRSSCRPTFQRETRSGAVRQGEGDLRPARLLFNNAGIGAPAVPLEDLPLENWQDVVDTNLTGLFLCTQEAIKIMKAQKPARRPHHQQRLDLRAYAAAVLGRLYRDQARHHRPDQVDRARLPRTTTSACGQIDIGNAATPLTERMVQGRRAAAGRHHDAGAAHGGRAMSAARSVYMASLPLDTNVLFMTVMANQDAVRRPRLGVVQAAWSPMLDGWHEFYILLGTAAAALVALLFVAVSIGAGFFSRESRAPAPAPS